MAKKVKSLSEQMAELSNVAPGDADVDPESDVDGFDAVKRHGADESDEDAEEEARSHARHNYVDVQPSKMRKQANFMEAVDEDQMRRYEGVKTTRREMMGDDEDEDNAEDDEEESEENLGESEDGDESVDQEEESYGGREEVVVEEEEEEEEEESGEDSEEEGNGKAQVRFKLPSDREPSSTALSAAQSDEKLLQDLRKRSKEDADKGRDARKQMDNWGRLLSLRIRGQKVFRGAGRIPAKVMKDAAPELAGADEEAYESSLDSLDELSSHLFSLQRQLLQSFTIADSRESDIVSPGLSHMKPALDTVSRPSKRSHSDVEDSDDHLEALLQLDQLIFEPLWRDVLARWSSRTSVSVEDGQKSKFESSLKAMDQSAENQIDRGLTGDSFDRLRKRTRVWRGSEQESRISMVVNGSNEADSEEDETDKGKEQADVFDDSDFYAAMLRELIDSRGASSVMAGQDGTDSSLAWAQAAKRASKKNRNAEARASKGRKLRFDVQEKVENFMPPIPRETWSKDQIDRLFRQLKGVAVADQPAEEGKTGLVEDEKVDLAGLRLFG